MAGVHATRCSRPTTSVLSNRIAHCALRGDQLKATSIARDAAGPIGRRSQCCVMLDWTEAGAVAPTPFEAGCT
jgi:hypothetical protein